MRRRPAVSAVLLAVLAVLAATACQGSNHFATARPGAPKAAYDRRAIGPDDVTSGLAIVEAADPGSNPLGGAFFNDGGNDDTRGRTEDYFGKLAAAGPDLRLPVPGRLLVYNGQIKVEVSKPGESIEQFLAMVVEWGGYLQSQVDTTVTVRIPAMRFDAAFALLRESGRVLREQRRADDVTEEFTDLGIRIDNARKSRDRLLEVLQKAEKVEDVLAVEKELRRLTEEIERMEGRRKYLGDQVAMATMQADFQGLVEAPKAQHRRRPSRFHWINLVGAERVMGDF